MVSVKNKKNNQILLLSRAMSKLYSVLAVPSAIGLKN